MEPSLFEGYIIFYKFLEFAHIYQDFIISRWLCWRGVSLHIDSVKEESHSIDLIDREWDFVRSVPLLNDKKLEYVGEFKKIIENTQKPYSFTYISLIYANK